VGVIRSGKNRATMQRDNAAKTTLSKLCRGKPKHRQGTFLKIDNNNNNKATPILLYNLHDAAGYQTDLTTGCIV